jgi:hypothetical protein
MFITKLDLEPLLYVVRHMRARDRDEICALIEGSDEEIALWIWKAAQTGRGWVAFGEDMMPVAVFGAWHRHAKAFTFFSFATPQWQEVCLPVTRFIRNAVLPTAFGEDLMEFGDCYALSDYPRIHRWIELLGGKADCRLTSYGKNGEDFTRFVWTKPI